MKKYKNDRKNIETEIPDIPMKKKEITELEKHAYCCLAEEAFERIRQSFEEADEEKVLQKYVEVLLELAGKERETSLALITALAHDHATYELSVVIRDLARKVRSSQRSSWTISQRSVSRICAWMIFSRMTVTMICRSGAGSAI